MHASKWSDPGFIPSFQPSHPSQSPQIQLKPTATPFYPETPTDEFAQTRSPDDLFADDFTPIPNPDPEPAPAAKVVSSTPAQSSLQQSRYATGNMRGAPRGRYNLRGDRANFGPRVIPPLRPATAGAEPTTEIKTIQPSITATPLEEQAPAHERNDAEPTTAEEQPLPDAEIATDTTSTAAQAPRVQPNVPAVRGDRTATGGVKRDKLSADELTARIAAIKLKNADLLAAHERASADEASFQVREAEVLERRKVETQVRQVMMGEREKNRMRKLQAQGVREWDEGKAAQQELNMRGGLRRGAFGGVAGTTRQYVNETPVEADEPVLDSSDLFSPERRGGGYRGRGGRGGNHGRGRGRGGYDAQNSRGQNGQQQGKPVAPQQPLTALDFPALPPVDKKADATANGENRVKGPSWADEMDGGLIAYT